jgi:hypothetical protein
VYEKQLKDLFKLFNNQIAKNVTLDKNFYFPKIIKSLKIFIEKKKNVNKSMDKNFIMKNL